MKVRESGMPEATYWETLFDVPLILDALGIDNRVGDAVEFGCGYGTFAVPAAQRIRGVLYALDLDPVMTSATSVRARSAGCHRVEVQVRDFAVAGTGLLDGSIGYAMPFNILHAEHPEDLLREACRVLVPGGRVGVIHWNPDPTTPRGPPMVIRPLPEEVGRWLREAGFIAVEGPIDLPPYHYGWTGTRR